MKLLAISGGPDSMLLLEKYKKQKIVVAHINYNKRQDSYIDEQIVKNFCKKYSISLEVLNTTKKLKGNFQNAARDLRYDFFKKVYKKYNCTKLLLAHHKSDFLETALMQLNSKRKPLFYGIKKNNYIKEMHIYRPFIKKYWKEEITKILNQKKIKYVIDSSNALPIFERNKLRINLNKLNKINKNNLFIYFCKINSLLNKKQKEILRLYLIWKKSNYSSKKFQTFSLKEEIIFHFIHEEFINIKISSGKINNIIEFIQNNKNNNSILKLNNDFFIKKQNNFIKKINI